MNYEKNFSYNKYALSIMPFLASRHFRTYPFPNSWRGYLLTNFCFNEIVNAADIPESPSNEEKY